MGWDYESCQKCPEKLRRNDVRTNVKKGYGSRRVESSRRLGPKDTWVVGGVSSLRHRSRVDDWVTVWRRRP